MINNIVTWPYRLRRGHGDNPAEGACAMDAVNWLVHGKHGDAPECACPVIGAYVIRGNDSMPDDVRQRLLTYLPRIAGSRSQQHEAARVRVLVLAAVRVFAPMALEAAGLHAQAATLRALPDNTTCAASYVAADAAAARAAYAAADAADAAADAAVAAARAAADAADVAAARAARAAADAAADVAADAAARAARAADAAARAADAADAAAYVWDEYFIALGSALDAGPQGEAWSADVAASGVAAYQKANGLLTPATLHD